MISNLNFEKHLLKKHMMDRIQYKDMYGSLEYTRLVYYRSVYMNTVRKYVKYTGVH